ATAADKPTTQEVPTIVITNHSEAATETEEPEATTETTSADEIPQSIRQMCQEIDTCKKRKNGVPIASHVRKIFPEHFNSSGGHLRRDSPLYAFAGDTRLMEKRTWDW